MEKSRLDHSKCHKAKLVLVDDDPSFCNIMSCAARHDGISLEFYESLLDMGSVARMGLYDVAIVDYDLGVLNGVEIAEYLSALFGDMPMILISATERRPEPSEHWPKSIYKFVHKGEGYQAILDAALEAASRTARRNNAVRSSRDADADDPTRDATIAMI